MHNSMTILLRLVVDLLRQRGRIDMYQFVSWHVANCSLDTWRTLEWTDPLSPFLLSVPHTRREQIASSRLLGYISQWKCFDRKGHFV